jgi:FtsP/CotA-like multicopper oxidase with cupredoxin domain
MARLVIPVLLSLLASALAAPTEKRASCANTATSRNCWGDYDINTDYYTDGPTTGNTVTYNWEITETTGAPDGYERSMMLINGQFPGPLVEANWGDTVVVNVKNSLTTNGTSIHWHGIRQLGTNEMDGAVGVTQCPIAPGDSFTYTWKATQYGTSWYHRSDLSNLRHI